MMIVPFRQISGIWYKLIILTKVFGSGSDGQNKNRTIKADIKYLVAINYKVPVFGSSLDGQNGDRTI